MNQDWSIQSRGVACSVTGTPFEAGQYFHTLLFDDKTVLRREDLSEESFKQRSPEAPQPFSHWRSKFEPAPPKAPEPLGKQTAEDLLRKYMADPNPGLANVRYILALMLERKRQLKEVEVRKNEDGSLTRIYQHGKSGEAFVIPDPGLKLSQVAEVQSEVSALLAAPAPAVETEAPTASTDAQTSLPDTSASPDSAEHNDFTNSDTSSEAKETSADDANGNEMPHGTESAAIESDPPKDIFENTISPSAAPLEMTDEARAEAADPEAYSPDSTHP